MVMQISRIYSNHLDLFRPINFNCREQSNYLNVIYGDVTDSTDELRDSHNLGKTTLIYLIDFLLLKDISGQKHFLETHKELFSKFVFYIELALNDGGYLTIRRPVESNTSISLKRHEDMHQDYVFAEIEIWDHHDLSLAAARELVDAMLNIKVISPYDYRKGITYYLRTQGDYGDVLQLQKFQSGKHVQWKPFVMNMLSYDESLVKAKYELDKEIEGREEEKKKKEYEVQIDEHDIHRVSAEISNLRNRLNETEEQLDRFEFSKQERELIRELVGDIESRIVEINQELYNIRTDIRNIDHALSNKILFNTRDIDKIFSEAGIYFPDQIKKSYDELLAFNKSLTKERNSTLRSRRKQLAAIQSDMQEEAERLDKKRQSHKNILDNSDTLDKFKSLQRKLADGQAQLEYLQNQYERLKSLDAIQIEINKLKRHRSEITDEIGEQIKNGSIPQNKISKYFNEYCNRVLDHDALFYIKQNTNGNVEFTLDLKDRVSAKASMQSEGKSYKQLLCALFDLSLLKTYENNDYYHFVYHDGIFEGLDDRKKRAYLSLVRDVVKSGRIQYILSIIDSDIPRDSDGNRIEFTNDEIILRLHDDGDDGRLFKIPEF